MLCREFRMGQQDIFSKLISTIFCTVVLCSLRIVYDFDKFRHFYPLLFDRWSSDQKRSTLLCPDILTQGCNAYANTYHRPYWTQVREMSRMYRFLLDVSSQQSSSAGLLELELALASYGNVPYYGSFLRDDRRARFPFSSHLPNTRRGAGDLRFPHF